MRYQISIPVVTTALSLIACGGGQQAQAPASDTPTSGAADSSEEAGSASEGATSEAGGAGESPAEGAGSSDAPEFQKADTRTAKDTHGVTKSTLKPTKTEAHLKFVVVKKDDKKTPIPGIVVVLKGPDGKKRFTGETDATGFADLLVPKGEKYEVLFLSLSGRDIAARLTVDDKPNFTMKLTLRYKGYAAGVDSGDPPRLVLEGVNFDTGKASIRKDSFPQLDGVVEYLTHKKSARVEISGHTDNVGNKKKNKALSEQRAKACRDYLISKGVDGGRITAVGYGDERPLAPNNTPEGREQNRRIEATEI